MGKYGEAATNAIALVLKEGKAPKEAWHQAAQYVFDGPSAQKKGCPRGAFLGLCEAGIVKGIPKGKYTKSVKNKEYGLHGYTILQEHPELADAPNELWARVAEGEIRHNSQMDVVIAVWQWNNPTMK